MEEAVGGDSSPLSQRSWKVWCQIPHGTELPNSSWLLKLLLKPAIRVPGAESGAQILLGSCSRCTTCSSLPSVYARPPPKSIPCRMAGDEPQGSAIPGAGQHSWRQLPAPCPGRAPRGGQGSHGPTRARGAPEGAAIPAHSLLQPTNLLQHAKPQPTLLCFSVKKKSSASYKHFFFSLLPRSL